MIAFLDDPMNCRVASKKIMKFFTHLVILTITASLVIVSLPKGGQLDGKNPGCVASAGIPCSSNNA